MNNKDQYIRDMQTAGVCDERGAAFCATAAGLPDGSFGLCLLGVMGNDLTIRDTDMKGRAGRLIYTIPLKQVTDLSINSFLLEIVKGYSFRFNYEGFTYTFKNCAQNKAALAVIRSEAGQA